MTQIAEIQASHKLHTAVTSANVRVRHRSWAVYQPATSTIEHPFDPAEAGYRAAVKHAEALRRLSD